MSKGIFGGLLVGLYRRTCDGRRVCAHRTLLPWRKRWCFIAPEEEARYERRVVRVHIASMVLMLVLLQLAGDRLFSDPRWFIGFLLVVPLPGSQRWVTAGLAEAEIDESALEPIDRAAVNLESARATGAPTLWVLLVAGLAMAAGQLYVLLTDGAWWSYLGLAMFSAATVLMGRQLLLLRAADCEKHAS